MFFTRASGQLVCRPTATPQTNTRTRAHGDADAHTPRGKHTQLLRTSVPISCETHPTNTRAAPKPPNADSPKGGGTVGVHDHKTGHCTRTDVGFYCTAPGQHRHCPAPATPTNCAVLSNAGLRCPHDWSKKFSVIVAYPRKPAGGRSQTSEEQDTWDRAAVQPMYCEVPMRSPWGRARKKVRRARSTAGLRSQKEGTEPSSARVSVLDWLHPSSRHALRPLPPPPPAHPIVAPVHISQRCQPGLSTRTPGQPPEFS